MREYLDATRTAAAQLSALAAAAQPPTLTATTAAAATPFLPESATYRHSCVPLLPHEQVQDGSQPDGGVVWLVGLE